MKIKSLVKISLLGLVGMSLFSGCAVKEVNHKYFPKEKIDTYILRPGSNSPSWNVTIKKANLLSLEVAAEDTLKKGYKYFAFTYPKTISNINGSTMNTAKEFLKKCNGESELASQAKFLLTLGFYVPNNCKIFRRNGMKAVFAIKMYKEKPKDILVYNAKAVLDYLKKTGKYESTKDLKYNEEK